MVGSIDVGMCPFFLFYVSALIPGGPRSLCLPETVEGKGRGLQGTGCEGRGGGEVAGGRDTAGGLTTGEKEATTRATERRFLVGCSYVQIGDVMIAIRTGQSRGNCGPEVGARTKGVRRDNAGARGQFVSECASDLIALKILGRNPGVSARRNQTTPHIFSFLSSFQSSRRNQQAFLRYNTTLLPFII